MVRRSSALLITTIIGVSLLTVSCVGEAPSGGVYVLTADGDINPVMAGYVTRGIAEAARRDADAVTIELDTPGGLDAAMRDIVQAIDGSPVPVIVYVAPSGARAASAGTFITMAGHVAAMAPNTTIGAAHPVALAGQNIASTLDQKIENDAVAYIRSIAELRGRNADWAEQAVRQSVSITDTQAVQLSVVDGVAPSLDALLSNLDGRTIRLNDGREVQLRTAGVPVRNHPMGAFERFLLVLSDPNIAFLLLTLGAVAFVIDLFQGTLVLGVVGASALTVGLFSLGTLPINWAGVALMGLAILLIGAELVVGSYGLLALAGLLALGASGFLLTRSSDPNFQVSRWLAVAVPAGIGVGLGGITLFAFRTRRREVAVGAERLIGAEGSARSPIDPDGLVFIQGELWQASASHPIKAGERVTVTGRAGLHLTVQPTAAHEAGATDAGPGGTE